MLESYDGQNIELRNKIALEILRGAQTQQNIKTADLMSVMKLLEMVLNDLIHQEQMTQEMLREQDDFD